MAGPSRNHRHELVNEPMAPAIRGSVDVHSTFGSIIRRPSIVPSDPFLPNTPPVNFGPEPADSMSSSSALSSSFAEVTGPFIANTRAGNCEVYSLTTGNMSCFRDRFSSFKWFGFRNGDQKVEHFDRNFQFPHNPAATYAREIMALHKALHVALYYNYSGQHTTLKIKAALNRIQSEIDRHLFSDVLILSTVHIIYDFIFLESHLRDGKMIDVKVVVTIEFYQAPWRTRTRRWNCGGSLNCMNLHYYNTDAKVQHCFEELVTLDPTSDSHLVQQVNFVASSHAPHQPTALPAAAVNPGALMTYCTQTTTTSPAPLNAARQDSQATSSLVSGFDLDAGDVSMTNRSMFSNNVGIDLSQHTPSGTDTLPELGLSDNQLHINPSSSQGCLDMQQGSPASSSFQQVPSATNMSVWLSLPSFTPAHQMIDDPVTSSEVIDNNSGSLFKVVSNLHDGDAPVANLESHQPATNPRPAMPAYSRPSPTPTSTTSTSTTQTSTTKSARSYSCPYMVCTHKPFATKWSMETHANTHAGVRFRCPHCELDYARPGDRTRHIQKEHLGYLYRCDHCQKERSRKPADNQLDGCDNNGRKHRYQRHALPSAPTSVSVSVDAP